MLDIKLESKMTYVLGGEMNYEKIITEIKSVREFKGKKVDTDLVSMIIDSLSQQQKLNDSELVMEYVEDGKGFAEKYDGKIGYHGKIISAPSYVLIFGQNDLPSKMSAGYSGEWLRFAFWNSGIGSCWVSAVDGVNYTELFSRKNNETLLACIAIGSEYTGFFKQNLGKVSDRKGIAEFVYRNSWKEEISWEELERLGLSEVFYLTKLAPSWGNEQPWAFLINNSECKLFIDKSKGKDYSVDSGIIALFFVKACETKGLKVNVLPVSESNAEKHGDFELQLVFSL